MEREKILNGLRCHSGCERGFDCDNCDYIGNGDCSELLAKDALALLTEQEPIEPVDDGHGSLICGNQGYECGCVGRYDLTTKVVEKYCNFCPECGRKVKWDEIN